MVPAFEMVPTPTPFQGVRGYGNHFSGKWFRSGSKVVPAWYGNDLRASRHTKALVGANAGNLSFCHELVPSLINSPFAIM